MSLLDVSIVAVALPSMREGLGASPAAIQWVVSGYALTFGLALVPAGRLGDAFGRRRMFLAALAGFVVCSAAAGRRRAWGRSTGGAPRTGCRREADDERPGRAAPVSRVRRAQPAAGGGDDPERVAEELDLQQEQVLRHHLLRRHVGDPGQRQHAVRAPAREQCRRQPQGVRGDHVVVGQPVHQQQRAGQLRGVGQQRGPGVRVGCVSGRPR